MAEWLRQVTAGTITLRQGPFIDIDGAALTGLTISQADVRLSKNGGDFAQKNDATAATHDEGGWYIVTYDATDLGTLGTLEVSVQETGALPYFKSYMIVSQQVWDSLFGADKLQVHTDEITAGIISATAIGNNAIDADAIATDAITAIQAGLSTFDHTTDTVLASMAQALPGSPTADTVGNALKNASGSLPQATAPGGPGGLPIYENLVLGELVTVATATSGGDFTLTSAAHADYAKRPVLFLDGPNAFLTQLMTTYTDATNRCQFTGLDPDGGTDSRYDPFPNTPGVGNSALLIGIPAK